MLMTNRSLTPLTPEAEGHLNTLVATICFNRGKRELEPVIAKECPQNLKPSP